MKYFFLAFLLFSATGVGVYAYLGGFRAPAVALETTSAPIFVVGQPYRGPAQSEFFAQLFRQASDAQAAGHYHGDLTNIFLNSPEKARDTVQAFVGIAVADTTAPALPGWRYRVVPAGQRVMAARLKGTSYLLAPGKLYPAAFEAIKAQKLTQRDFFLERFSSDDRAEVWVGVK